ncbi:hypothetical protein KKD88_00280 [Patescibacteria group bacterium]|nr:hypothetical protein [Patescibacteria group bacterium]MBU1034511.1 hypothetical protein [Patescibacteria group bacterium]MBU1629501.1 hypothetical protein [Patescibacteria group bacterium]
MKPTVLQRVLPPLFFLLSGAVALYVLCFAAHPDGSRTLVWAEVWQLAILAVIAGGLTVSLLRRAASRFWWEVILNATIFLGVWFLFLLLGVSLGTAIALSSGLTLVYMFYRTVWTHDIFYLLGAIGVAINFAMWLPGKVLLIGLVAFTIYDMVAGAPGGPIHKLVAMLTQYSLVPGMIIPKNLKGFTENLQQAIKGEAIFLGAGDLILPLSLVAGAALKGWQPAVFVALGAVLGAAWLGFGTDLRPRPALPPLAIGAGIPFLFFSIF